MYVTYSMLHTVCSKTYCSIIFFFFIFDALIYYNLFYKYRYLQTIKINDKDVKIKKWKIGQFFQYMFPLIEYDYDPDNPFTIGNFKAGIHRPEPGMDL